MSDEGIELVQCQPNYTIHFSDGETFTVSTDLSVMKEQVEKFEGKDGFGRYVLYLSSLLIFAPLEVNQLNSIRF